MTIEDDVGRTNIARCIGVIFLGIGILIIILAILLTPSSSTFLENPDEYTRQARLVRVILDSSMAPMAAGFILMVYRTCISHLLVSKIILNMDEKKMWIVYRKRSRKETSEMDISQLKKVLIRNISISGKTSNYYLYLLFKDHDEFEIYHARNSAQINAFDAFLNETLGIPKEKQVKRADDSSCMSRRIPRQRHAK